MTDIFNAPEFSFIGADKNSSLNDANLVAFGAPHGTPYPGVNNEPYASAPDSLREAMQEDARWLDHWDFDLDGPLLGDSNFRVADAGNLKTSSSDGPGNRDLIRQATAQILESVAVPIMMGGDDSTPIPLIEALKPLGPLTIIQIDAHIDWRDEVDGERYGYSSPMRRISEMPHIAGIVQVGLRAVGSAGSNEIEAARRFGSHFVTARDLHAKGISAALKHIPEGARCVITLDCDGLDPAAMPGVAARTPGGLTYTQVIDLIAGLGRRATIAGFDLVEFYQPNDIGGLTALTASRLVVNAIGAIVRHTDPAFRPAVSF